MSGSVSVAVIGCPTAGWVVDKVTLPSSSTFIDRDDQGQRTAGALVVSGDDRHVVHVVPVRVGRGLVVRRFLEHEFVCVVACAVPLTKSSVSVRENRPPSAPPRDNVSASTSSVSVRPSVGRFGYRVRSQYDGRSTAASGVTVSSPASRPSPGDSQATM